MPGPDRIRRGIEGGTQDRAKFSAEQSAWAALAHSVLGLATYTRQGEKVPERIQAGGGRMQQAVPLPAEVFNEMSAEANEGKLNLKPRPTLERINNHNQLQAMHSAAEAEANRTLYDGTLTPAAKKKRLRELMTWQWEINVRQVHALKEDAGRMQRLLGR